MSRTVLLSVIIAGIIVCLGAVSRADQTSLAANVLGYGQVKMTVQSDIAGSSVTRFACEDVLHADRMLSKIRADFSWDTTTGPSSIELPGQVQALETASNKILVFARSNTDVYAIVSPSPSAAVRTLHGLNLSARTAMFAAQRIRPASLDYYDLRPLSMNYLLFNIRGQKIEGPSSNAFLKTELDKAHSFWQPYGIDVNILSHQGCWGFGSPANADVQSFPFDYNIALSRQHGQSVSVMIGNQNAPDWIRDLYPDQVSVVDPNGLPCITNGALSVAGASWLSFSSSDDAYANVASFTSSLMNHIKQDAGDDLTMVRPLGGGRPGDELALHHGTAQYMDYDSQGQSGFRHWLRDIRGLSLADLSQRWYGDPHHLTDWDQVSIPSDFEFFGAYWDKANVLPLTTGWSWRADDPSQNTQSWSAADYHPDSAWDIVDLAPSYRQFLLYNNQPDGARTAWFRKQIDLTDFLKTHEGEPIYLVADTMESVKSPIGIWVNGISLGDVRPQGVTEGGVSVRIDSLIHGGANTICLKVPDGVIYGPVFLTTQEPMRYPNLGPCENARYVDMREWIGNERLVESWYREALPMRKQAPDSPMAICPGHLLFADRFLELKKQAGLTEMHDTGAFAGAYSPNLAGLTYTQGLYFTNEEGGTIADAALQTRQLAWMLLEGVAHHNYIDDAQVYMTWEQKEGWFKQNKRLLSLIAKSLRDEPSIAILHSPQAELRYFPTSSTAASWDLGRGGLQRAHFNNAYVTATEVENGMVDQYPILIDSNTNVMDDDLVAAIEKYVRAGGTFIALQDTGRNSYTESDTWPISRVTGFKVVGEHPEGMVTVLPKNPVLKLMAGMKLPGSGMALNWMGQDAAKVAPSVSLQPAVDECVPLALWEDGTIAAGMRQLGEGRVVVLGSTFWASNSDLAGTGFGEQGTIQTTFLSDLLTGLGVVRQVDCSSPDIWARRVETKNGLQEWFVLWNSSHGDVQNATVSFPAAGKPGRLIDEVTGEPIAFSYASGVCSVSGVSMDANAIRVIGIDRSDVDAAAAHWFEVKAKFETAPDRTIPIPTYPQVRHDAITLGDFRFRQIDTAAATSGSWLTEDDAASPWKSIGCGFWDEQGFSPTGVGVYRRTIVLAASLENVSVLIAQEAAGPVFLGTTTLYVNGREVGPAAIGPTDPSATVVDITRFVHPGSNEIAIKDAQPVSRGGYLGGLFCVVRPTLGHVQSLASGWRLYSDDTDESPTALPVAARGRYLAIDIDIPLSWDSKGIDLDIDQGQTRWIHYIMVNDRPIAYNSYGHLFPNLIRTNLAPWIKPGVSNRIELWGDPASAQTQMNISSVTIGTKSGS